MSATWGIEESIGRTYTFTVHKTTGRKKHYTNCRTLDPSATEDGGTSPGH